MIHLASKASILALLLIAPLLAAGISVSAEEPNPEDTSIVLKETVTDAARCTLPEHYDPEDVEFSDTFNDDGFATFWNGIEQVGLLGYDGSGGHTGEVWMCTRSSCKGGWLPVVSDFHWAGSSLLGYGASITIHSGQSLVPVTYSTCTGKANGFLVATSQARSVEGDYTASATHGGILASTSEGYAHISADANALGAYSYSWSYEGEGRVLGLEEKIKDSIGCDRIGRICEQITLLPIEIYGTGADHDIGS